MKPATAKLTKALLPMILLLLCASIAAASDVTGKWAGDFAAGDGNTYTLKFTFTQTGTAVTGSAETPHGSFDISDGKVGGDKIWFTVKMDEMTVKHEGTVKEDEIKLQVAFDGGGGEVSGPLTLKRVK
jgi:hypothetical protein